MPRSAGSSAGSTIVEATAGNTGVGLALIGVNRGYNVKLFVPEGFAEEKCILMRGFGAEVVRTPEDDGMAGAIRQAEKLPPKRSPARSWPASFPTRPIPTSTTTPPPPKSGSRWRAALMRFVAGVGTGGTFSGVARFLKERNPAAITIAVETEGSILQGGPPGKHRVEGIGVSFIPETFHPRSLRSRGDGHR